MILLFKAMIWNMHETILAETVISLIAQNLTNKLFQLHAGLWFM